MSSGYAIELKNNYAWSEDSVLLFTTHGCQIILLGDYESEQDAYFLLIDFNDAKCVKSASTDLCPDMLIEPENIGAKYISVLTDSNWDDEAHQMYCYKGTPKNTIRKHFVLSNHDVFHEVLAKSFTETKITNDESLFEKIKSCYLLSKAQLI